MGNIIGSSPGKCVGPQISEREKKELTYVGFTKEELKQLNITYDNKNKFIKHNIKNNNHV